MDLNQIAEICHSANKALCDINGDGSQKPWADAEDWQRESAVRSVQFALDNPDGIPQDQGVESIELDLMKDALFNGITKALKPFVG